MENKKRILVYPCGTEIGLEIFRSVDGDKMYDLFGGSSTYDHGRYIYKNHIDNLPYITDESTEKDILDFCKSIEEYNIDIIYPAMDGVLTVFAKYKKLIKQVLIAPDYNTCNITRSKKKTYKKLANVINVPTLYSNDSVMEFPVCVKPDIGQGSVDVKIVNSRSELSGLLASAEREMLICEYLPGEEYTVDCFTNLNGELIVSIPRKRNRIKMGISVNTFPIEEPKLEIMAKVINGRIKQKGGWFFQVKKSKTNKFTLLEVASRIAGASSCSRFCGINLPLLTVNEYCGICTDSVLKNDITFEVDRALYNQCKLNISYSKVYIDYDDTLVLGDKINVQALSFVIECINKGIKVFVLSRHNGDLVNDLKGRRILNLFDDIIQISGDANKCDYIDKENAIYIDDSYGERKQVFEKLGIPVFDVHNIECLKESRD